MGGATTVATSLHARRTRDTSAAGSPDGLAVTDALWLTVGVCDGLAGRLALSEELGVRLAAPDALLEDKGLTDRVAALDGLPLRLALGVSDNDGVGLLDSDGRANSAGGPYSTAL